MKHDYNLFKNYLIFDGLSETEIEKFIKLMMFKKISFLNLLNNKKSLKNDIKIINEITKEFKKTHEKISEISSKFTNEEKEELKILNLKI